VSARPPLVGHAQQKRPRRSKADIGAIRSAIYSTLEADHPATVRQVFYRLVSGGVIEKSEREYQGTVVRLLTRMRLADEVPFDWITDETRWMRKPRTHSGLKELLAETAQLYRRDLWRNSDCYVEVWLEKDALAGVVYETTSEFDVPLMVSRGFSSLTYVHSAASDLRERGVPAWIYQLGDHDPSGVDAARQVQRRLCQFAPEVEIHFERLAVTPAQIKKWKLPTRPTKKSDSRARTFKGRSVEVDAIEPRRLGALVRDAIERHVDPGMLNILRTVEADEREKLARIAARMTR